jgi:hypothetical protein
MNKALSFDPLGRCVTGPAGSLPVTASDEQALRFLMLLEGQCLQESVATVAAKYGCCRQRYYQLHAAYLQGGLPALLPHKTGPKAPSRRTDVVVRQVLRYRFLDPDGSAAVIVQKMRQTHFAISQRSVERILADYGLQKKTLRAQPTPATGLPDERAHPKALAPGKGRSPEPGTSNPSTPGR